MRYEHENVGGGIMVVRDEKRNPVIGEIPTAYRDLRVLDLMRQPPETIDVESSVRTAASRMAGSGIRFLPVCEGGGAVLA